MDHPLHRGERLDVRLLGIIDRFASKRITVVGDIIADEFIYGQIARVSREAPVLILRYDSTEIVPGGAGNAANNAAALGAVVSLVGIVGSDDAGRRLVRAFDRRVDGRSLIRLKGYRTPTKTRILAGGVHSAKQQVVRIDRQAANGLPEDSRGAFADRVGRAVEDADAVIFSDYGGGLVTPALVEQVHRRAARSARRRAAPILIDTRYDLLKYRGVTACTPNESEVEHVLGVHINDDPRRLERAGRAILKRTRMQAVLVTRGSRGMALFESGRPTMHIPIFGSDEIADVTGAGDTVISSVALALASGASFYEAARLANYAGGLVVMKRGTAIVSQDELREAVTRDASA
ncbi:MAG: bifunctional hydroxymethylpyrimidine kinase/phosphomethylpyrimidine kinase [Acidobacteria bacterium]|nr:bifunctional hydroxymethylpyrimidine kinase/phosphomethylpyrimidine kinase [Acidobacteriota bacterium]